MPLAGICPACGASFSLEQALTDGEARQALAAALALPPELGARVVRYMGLHAPAGRRVQWPKLTRLLTGLTERLHAGEVTRRGVSHAAPLALWAAALDEVLAAREAGTLVLPLDGHGYLDEVAWRLAAKDLARARGDESLAAVPLHPSHLPAAPPMPAAPRRPAEGIPRGLEDLRRIIGRARGDA